MTQTTDESISNKMLILFLIFCLVLFLTFIGVIMIFMRFKKRNKIYPRIIDVSIRNIDEDF
jgi:uncharacterized membrane protein